MTLTYFMAKVKFGNYRLFYGEKVKTVDFSCKLLQVTSDLKQMDINEDMWQESLNGHRSVVPLTPPPWPKVVYIQKFKPDPLSQKLYCV